MWILHPDDDSPFPRIWIRTSQKKITLPSPLHRAHLILDLVCPARVTTPSRLSQQTIINLAHNGVPDDSFNILVEKELQAIIEPLTNWSDPHATLAIAKAIDQAGHVTGSRLQRLAGGSTRALGLGRDFHRDDDDNDEHDEANDLSGAEPQIHSGRDIYSGAPQSLFESAYDLIGKSNFLLLKHSLNCL
jgi:RNA-dependent RNA polymerase